MRFNEVLTGNCLEILGSIPDNSVDHIVTDPPYNISDESKQTMVGPNIVPAKFGEWDEWTEEEYDVFIFELLAQFFRTAKLGANCLIWLDRAYTGIAWRASKKIGWTPRSIIAAIKRNPARVKRKTNLKSGWESCLWLSKGSVKVYDEEEFHSNVIFYNIGNGKVSNHKTEKYEEMIEPLIEWFTRDGDIVLDAFSGSGTIPTVCKQKNRKYIAIEKDPYWAGFTKNRLELIGDVLL